MQAVILAEWEHRRCLRVTRQRQVIFARDHHELTRSIDKGDNLGVTRTPTPRFKVGKDAMRAARKVFLAALSGSLAGCSDRQSALSSHAVDAQHLCSLIWVFVVFLGAIWLIVMIALAFAMRHRDDNRKSNEGVASAVISICAGLTGLIVIGLTFASFAGQREMQRRDAPLLVNIVGHQWWWELR